jgi:hypothetical protein
VIAVGVLAALTGLAATPQSVYVTGGSHLHRDLAPGYGTPDQASGRFLERVGETLLGVGVALLSGVVAPALRRSGARTSARSGS